MANDVRLVLLETSANQAYIFTTNKLRDIVGASQLTYEVGTELVSEAMSKVFKRSLDFKNPDQLKREPQLGDAASSGIEVIVATSGKALLLIEGFDKASDFIEAWSRLVLERAPGVDASGVISSQAVSLGLAPGQRTNGAYGIGPAVQDVHQVFEEARSLRTAPQARFARLPSVAPCAFSGLPAAKVWPEGIYAGNLLSHSSCAKWESLPRARERVARSLGKFYCEKVESGETKPKEGDPFVAFLHDIEEQFQAGWLAVVHADGNGLGQIFLHFDRFFAGMTARDYIDGYREFSLALDQVCLQSFHSALESVFGQPLGNRVYPVMPIVVGGDDMTVALDGKIAIRFAHSFLKNFLEKSEGENAIKAIAEHAYGRGHGRLGSCAGVSIAKPHFPFSTSYALAEQLLRSAKRVKKEIRHEHGKDGDGTVPTPVGALDFHILYDSSATSIDDIRSNLRWEEKRQDDKGDPYGHTVWRTAKPFVVSASSAVPGNPWLERHRWERFDNALYAIRRPAIGDKSRPDLPSSQAHDVRLALFRESVEAQEEYWGSLLARYEEFGKAWKEGEGNLYRSCSDVDDTVFLDALEAREFLKN